MKNDNVKFKISKGQIFLLLLYYVIILVLLFFMVFCFVVPTVFNENNNTRKNNNKENKIKNECAFLCSKVTHSNNIPAISSLELSGGMYYGNLDQKKKGTPSDWAHVLEGTRSSSWRSPKAGKNYECDCYKNQNKVENIDINIETGNKDKVDDSRAALIKAVQYLKDGNTEEAIKYFTLTPTKNESLIRSFTKEQRDNLANWLENARVAPEESSDDYKVYRYYFETGRTEYMEFGMGKNEDGEWVISNW